MRRTAAEWSLQPSRRQRSLNLLFLLLAAALIIPFSIPLALLVAVAGLLLMVVVSRPPVPALGVGNDGWWISWWGERRSVEWRSGSQRLPDQLYLVWGFWPWQTLHIRADSCRSADDFRRLKAALYGSQ